MGYVRPYAGLRKQYFSVRTLLQVIIAPLIQTSALLYLHHILVCARKHDADSKYLVGGNFPFNSCRLDALGYGMVTVSHFVGFSYQLSVQMSAGGGSIGWYRFTLDVFEPTTVGRTCHYGRL